MVPRKEFESKKSDGTMDSVLASHPLALGSNLGVPPKIVLLLLIIIDGTAKNSGQRLDNVN